MILTVLYYALGPGVKSLHEKQKNRRMAQHAEQAGGTERVRGENGHPQVYSTIDININR